MQILKNELSLNKRLTYFSNIYTSLHCKLHFNHTVNCTFDPKIRFITSVQCIGIIWQPFSATA